MRNSLFISVLFLLGAASIRLDAVDLTSGSINMVTSQCCGPMTRTSTLIGPGLSIAVELKADGPGCCPYNLNRRVQGNFGYATVTYQGTTYTLQGPTLLLPAGGNGLQLDISLNGGIKEAIKYPVSRGVAADGTTSPFTLTGTVSLVVGGQTIFSNLSLNGYGVAQVSPYSYYDPEIYPSSTVAYQLGTLNPFLLSIDRNTVPIGPTTFVVNGTGFNPATAFVEISRSDSIANAALLIKTTTQLVFQASLAPGSYTMQIRNGAGGSATNSVEFTVGSQPAGSYLIPLSSSCRVADTRQSTAIPSKTSRDFTFENCNIPSNALAVALNVTVVPQGQLGFLSVWPAGQPQPVVSTMNSLDGRVKANAALVGLGTDRAVSVYVTDTAHVVLDVSGYFVPKMSIGSLSYIPGTPCRVLDTRITGGIIPALSTRKVDVFPSCLGQYQDRIEAYSLNVTAIPAGPLGFLTLFPDGSARPATSTLNAVTGAVTANAAIAKAGTGGALNVYVTEPTHVVIDVNGVFRPFDSGGLALYAGQPCRVLDSRNAAGQFGGPVLGRDSTRELSIAPSDCNVPDRAKAYVMNATVLPQGVFGYLTLFASDLPQPTVSTLNAVDGALTSNAAIVTGGDLAGRPIKIYTSDTTHLLLDISGYFAP